MRRRCHTCGSIATTKKPCTKCGSYRPMVHCHDRAHCNHTLDGRAVGYEGEDLGPCRARHAHPHDDLEHWDEPQHSL